MYMKCLVFWSAASRGPGVTLVDARTAVEVAAAAAANSTKIQNHRRGKHPLWFNKAEVAAGLEAELRIEVKHKLLLGHSPTSQVQNAPNRLTDVTHQIRQLNRTYLCRIQVEPQSKTRSYYALMNATRSRI